uniref:Uncharacterized protein n=1 Tax=Rhizophora mucronata TaxID=61149 RepID=A0A2P2PKB8_RHIMU
MNLYQPSTKKMVGLIMSL